MDIDSQTVDLPNSQLLHQLITVATHEADNVLDLFVTYADGHQHVQSINVADVTGLSDRKLIVVATAICGPKPTVKKLKFRKIGRVDQKIFSDRISCK